MGRKRTRLRQRQIAKQKKSDLRIEPLEAREMLAGDFRLSSILTNAGDVLSAGEVRTTAPSELTLIFSRGQMIDPSTLGSIEIVQSGFDDVFGNSNDITLTPGFIGIGEEPNEVVVRFAERLVDDSYQIRVGSGVMNETGNEFNMGESLTIPFSLNLGPRVIAVVPQPIRRDGATPTAARNQIDVYFNNDDLPLATAQNPAFYQLIFTNDTVSSADDGDIINPVSVSYSAAEDKAILTFAAHIEDLATGPGTYRLRIGDSSPRAMPPLQLPDPPQNIGEPGEPGETIFSANTDFGTLANRPLVITNQITAFAFENPSAPNTPIFTTFPGSETDPGHRLANFVTDFHVTQDDTSPGAIETLNYNFRSVYGFDNLGNPVVNQITASQKQRAREALDLYSNYLGIQFVETPDSGFTIATGRVNTVNGPFQAGFDFDALGAAGVSDISQLGGAAGLIDVAVVNGGRLFTDDFGGNYFRQVMQEIGHVIGYGEATDLPEGTLFKGETIESLFEVDFPFIPQQRVEAVFPGPHDIVHGRYMFNNNANDIDLYRFQVAETGVFSAETFANRREEASSLDSVLRLFRETNSGTELIAQNDDYFGGDSFLQVELTPGTYYIGVSSTGNDAYDPTFFSGGGGTSSGAYELRVELKANVTNRLADSTGQAFDGDNDGRPGGTYDFWFRAVDEANTHYVDKTAAIGGDGSLASPFNNVRLAMDLAQPGDIVRVLGNNIGDNDLTDDVPYAIGFDNLGNVLPDGSSDGTLKVKRDVVLMIDEGAMFKLRRGAILVGSDSSVVNRSGGSIQVLGTPVNSVIFTSVNDETVGTDVDSLSLAPRRGDWGGIRIRRDVDNTAGQLNYENQGIFFDSINHANIQFGGGVLAIGSVSQAVNPISMIDARPAISHNVLTTNADAAMSATPNSFEETKFNTRQFQTSPFTPDYDRVGPDIHHNRLTDNTTNGLFIVDRRGSSASQLRMSVSARFDDTDITHVIADTLLVTSNPGGLVQSTVDGPLVARLAGRLAIDPGVVVKLDGGRIEVGMGANLYAEGSNQQPIVFTSLLDDRYGGGGTFNTNNGPDQAAPENWGGIMLRQTAGASFDNVVFAYGGGNSPIEGGFAGFNVLEVHQAELRVANSIFEFNGDGTTAAITGDRVGRGLNDPATIYIRGASPIIVGNTFRGNDSSVININVDSLDYQGVLDYGRTIGTVGTVNPTLDNQGPLVRNNVVDSNGINGMVVRGGVLQTESVWDDTDIVHVLFDKVEIPDFHTFGGLRLKSSPSQSLVVKSLGKTAGFVVTGAATGTPDHIGGSLQVLGQPGKPVIMTSFYDDTVGAGLDQNDQTQVDTDGQGRPTRTVRAGEEGSFQIDLNFGPRINQFPELMDAARLAANIWEQNLQDPITVTIDVELSDTLSQQAVAGFAGAGLLTSINPPQNNFGGPFGFAFSAVERTTTTDLFSTTSSIVEVGFEAIRNALITDAGVHESLLADLPSRTELNVEFPTNVAVPFDVANNMQLTSANALALGQAGTNLVSAFDPNEPRDGQVLITDNLDLFDLDRTDGTKVYREDFQTVFMTQIGEILGFTSSMDQVEAFLDNPVVPDGSPDQTVDIPLSPLDLFRFAPGAGSNDFANSPRRMDPQLRDHVFYAGGELDFTGYPFEGIVPGDIPLGTGYDDQRGGDEINDNFSNRWRDDSYFADGRRLNFDVIGIMDPFSTNRDEILQSNDSTIHTQGLLFNISEADRLAFDSIGYDVVGGAPGDWAGIRMEQSTYDGNIVYVSEQETSFNRNELPATAETLGSLAENRNVGNETLHLGFEIHGMLDRPNDVDVYSFRAVAGTPVWFDIDNSDSALDTVVSLITSDQNVLAQSDNSLFEQFGSGSLVGSGQPFSGIDLYTSNALDAGMRVDLPGTPGEESIYYVEVTSRDAATDGRYELQVRLRERDEVPGTTVQFADIRFANTGIEIVGPPSDSPLLGEAVEDESLNDFFTEYTINPIGDDEDPANRYTTFDAIALNRALPYDVSAQYLGDLTKTRQGALSVFGSLRSGGLGTIFDADVDWYRFDINPDDRRFANQGVVFDIDFADGLGGPDSVVAVYQLGAARFTSDIDPNQTRLFEDVVPQLIFYSEGGVIAEDQATIGESSVLTGGSFGARDPYIGPVTMTGGTYFVAVSSAALIPNEVIEARATNLPLLQPISGDPNRGFRANPAVDTDTFPGHSFNPNLPAGTINSGEYQLEIRVVPLPGDSRDLFSPDANRERIQGQLVIANNSIQDSRTFGIRITPGQRDQRNYGGEQADVDFTNPDMAQRSSFRQENGQFNTADWMPHAGAPRALPGLNEERIVPGITIANNVIFDGMDGGIQLEGDPGGIVLDLFDLDIHFDADDEDGNDFVEGNLNRSQFTIWDHKGQSQTFQFTTDGATDPDKIPIRFDDNRDNDLVPFIENEMFSRTPNPPTLGTFLADEIMHALRLSNLDIQVYKAESNAGFAFLPGRFGAFSNEQERFQTGETDTELATFASPTQLYIEGAAEIGLPDVISGTVISAFFPQNANVAPLTAHVVQQGPVNYARVVNNTIVGRGGDLFDAHGVRDVGIIVEDNVSPTLLNNVIANFDVGIRSDLSANDSNLERRTFIGTDSSIAPDSFGPVTVFEVDGVEPINYARYGTDYFAGQDAPMHFRDVENSPTTFRGARPTIIGATIYQGNDNDTFGIGRGDFAITLVNSAPLFVDAIDGNFFPAEGSRAIDSSVNFLAERGYVAEVLTNAGIATNSIEAPDFDAVGIIRVDDPSVEPPDGIGSNVFKDRGALERGDFVGPTVTLVNPEDNGSSDSNPALNEVAVFGDPITLFQLKLNDSASLANPVFGSGIDDSSVVSGAIIVRRDGELLVDGDEYFLTYDATNDALRIIPVAGAWTPGNYTVELLNDENAVDTPYIRDLANNPLQANRPDGRTVFQIALGPGTDFGDAPAPYPTLSTEDGAVHEIVAGIFLGAEVTVEIEARRNSNATGDPGDDGVILPASFIRGVRTPVTVSASVAGFLNAWIDWNGNGSWEAGEQVFTGTALTPGQNELFVTTPVNTVAGETFARFRFSTIPVLLPTGPAPNGEVEDYIVVTALNPWQNSNFPLDVNNDGFTQGGVPTPTPTDAVLVINELNVPEFSDPVTGRLPITRPSDAPFLDVTGDGFVSPLDALLVINSLPTSTGAAAPLSAVVAPPLSSGATVFEPLADEDRNKGKSRSSLGDSVELAVDAAMAWFGN